jgi:uncharacterized membrane protein YhaH (DUF805 family)
MMDLLKRMFWFSGRVGRLNCFLFSIGVASVALGAFYLCFREVFANFHDQAKTIEAMRAAPRGVILPIHLLCLWMNLANNAKRLHDFNWSGWHQFGPSAIVLLAGALSAGSAAQLQGGHPPVALLLLIGGCMIAGSLYAIVIGCMMLFRRGSEGENHFGPPNGPNPDPLARVTRGPAQAAPAFAQPAFQPAAYHSPHGRPASFGRRGA